MPCGHDPQERLDRSLDLFTRSVPPGSRLLDERQRTGPVLRRQGRERRQPQELRRRRGIRRHSRHDPELQDLAGGRRVGRLEAFRRLTGLAAAEGFVRTDVAQDEVTRRHLAEVDDQVRALGQPHQQLVAVVGGQVDRAREEAALVADGPDLDAGDLAEVEDEEARLAPVEEAEPVAPLLHGLERPGVAVDHDGVAEELRVPDRGELPHRDVVLGKTVEEGPRVGVEQRPVGPERPVLDRDRDLEVGLVRGERVALPGRGAGEHRHRPVAAVPHRLVTVRAAPDQVEAGRTGIDVQPGHPQRVVVVPVGRRPVGVRVLEGRVARSPGDAVGSGGLGCEEVVPGAVSRRSRSGCRSPPAGTTPRDIRRSRRRPRRLRGHG